MGGMAAQIPIKNDRAANEQALEKVRQDKLREVRAGHDGTWVAHPGLVPIAKEIFDAGMKGANQISNKRTDVRVTAEDLLAVPEGDVTLEGLRRNVEVGLQYLESWLRGQGCVPINNLMEDAATAEICRAQLWQWLAHGARVKNASADISELIREAVQQESAKHSGGKMTTAAKVFEQVATAPDFPEFMTSVAYDYLD